MAYRFQRAESVPKGVHRIAREQLEGAIDSLRADRKRDEAIHDARKRLKKVRALLRLAKSEMGDLFDAENARLRDSGRALSEFRDAAIVIETFDGLVEEYRRDLGQASLDSIRRGLLQRKSSGERKVNAKDAMRAIAATLAASAKDILKWPLKTDGFEAIAPGLELAFRKGRKEMAAAHKHPTPENFHEWRKRVKDHWYHIRLLEDLWSDVMGGYQKSLKQLEDWLGSGHNLAVLRDKVTAEPAFYGTPEDVQVLMELIGKREKKLRRAALAMGERIYVEEPREFRKRMARLWGAWKD